MKKILLAIVIVALFHIGVYAADSFSVRTDSDMGDYIGGGKNRVFTHENKSYLTTRSAGSAFVEFTAESFDISSMSFQFASSEDTTLQANTLYEPAKRYPFRGKYNGIDIGGDGRGCNAILGKFFVHEYQYSDGKLVKAAIDFVQYCEENTNKGLYGSVRFNATVANSCDSNGCSEVRKRFGAVAKPSQPKQEEVKVKVAKDISKNTIEDALDTEKMSQLFQERLQKKSVERNTMYTFFYAKCDVDLLFESVYHQGSSQLLDKNMCGKPLSVGIVSANRFLSRIMGIGQPDENDEDEAFDTKQLVLAFKSIEKLNKGFVQKRQQLINKKKLSNNNDIMYSALIVYTDAMGVILGAMVDSIK